MAVGCTDPGHNQPECTGHRKGMRPCHGPAVAGSQPPRCRMHMGDPKARAKANLRAELFRYGLDGDVPDRDAGETMIRLHTQSVARCEAYADLLQTAYDAETNGDDDVTLPAGIRALIGHKYAVSRDGDAVPVEEAIRGLVQLEAAERDRCFTFAKLIVAANLAERGLQLDEKRVELVATALRAALVDAGLEDKTPEVVGLVARHLRAVAS